MLVVCNVLIGTLGPKPNITAVEQNVVVASLILLLSGVKISFQCNACKCRQQPSLHVPSCQWPSYTVVVVSPQRDPCARTDSHSPYDLGNGWCPHA